jgi:hypothetical protein
MSFLSNFQVNARITHWQTASEVNAELLKWLVRTMHYLPQHSPTDRIYVSHNKRLLP